MNVRRDRYAKLSDKLARLDDTQLRSLLGDVAPPSWLGSTKTIALGRSKVFVKRIPVTSLEHKNAFSTKNLYALPPFYHYGIGSLGFGAFRELASHVAATTWVLDGSFANFPLLYHHRIVRTHGTANPPNKKELREYVDYWNGDATIERWARDRIHASRELLLFFEHFPRVLQHWLAKNSDKTTTVSRTLRRTLAFLRQRGVVHFDAHVGNILADRTGVTYLTDFGLALDRQFADEREIEFFERHQDYDVATFFTSIGAYVRLFYEQLPTRRRTSLARAHGLTELSGQALTRKLVELFEQLHGPMRLHPHYVAQVRQRHTIIQTMMEFYAQLQMSLRKDTPYPQAKLRRLLT